MDDFEELSSYLYTAGPVMSVAIQQVDAVQMIRLVSLSGGICWKSEVVPGWIILMVGFRGVVGGLLCCEEEEEDSTQQHRTSGQVEGASRKLVADIGTSSASIEGYHVSLVSGDMYQEICCIYFSAKGQIYVVLQSRTLFLVYEELAEKFRLH